jgi:hypothetical protein
MIGYIDMVKSLAEALKMQERKPEDIGIEEVPQPYRNWSFYNFFNTNLKFLYESTTEQ